MTLVEESDWRRVEGRLKVSAEFDERTGIAILHCAGRVGFRREAELLAASAQQCLKRGCDLILDLRAVEAADSAGVGQLVLIHMQAEAQDSEVCIASAPEQVRKLLRLTNVASLFEFFDSVEEALSSWSQEVA
jgi:anti-anti-sigma factor